MYCPTQLMLSEYFKKPLRGALLHKFRDIIMGRASPFKLLEDTFSYTGNQHVGKQITPKEIPSGTGDPLIETEDMLEDENEKQLLMGTAGPLKKR